MTSKLTREQLHERARENVKALKMASRQTAFESAREEILADLQLAELALAAMDSEAKEPISFDEWSRKCALQITLCYPDFREKAQYIWDSARETQHVAPENCVTAEHRRVIEMLLNVCGAAFELADDSCQQDVDGEECHVVPDDAFQKLSDALDEIENTLPTEDIDRPDVFLAWSAMPRAALKSILQPGNYPGIPDCWCRTCRPVALNDMRFVVCPDCGNKRCPRANDHRNACTGSNEPGQEGSAHPDTPQDVKGD